jgi:hypothetical protein
MSISKLPDRTDLTAYLYVFNIEYALLIEFAKVAV